MNNLFNEIMGNNNDLISQFNKFKASFQGNPQEQVQQLLNSGKMSQEQYHILSQQATAFAKLLGIK